MESKFHKNSIITGVIDAYCLSCKHYFGNEDDITTHIETPEHRKTLASTIYFEKYKDDGIRKVKQGYYCEFCNILLSTASKVCLHIEDNYHINNKGMQLLKKSGNEVIAYANIVIKENAWNSLIDNTCVLCNEEFEDENVHKTNEIHKLKLIQSKVQFGADKFIYRKIDDASFQCMTCNMVYALNTITTHSNQHDHKILLQKSYNVLKTGESKETDKTNDCAFSVNYDETKSSEVNEDNTVSASDTANEKEIDNEKTKTRSTKPLDGDELFFKVLTDENYIAVNSKGIMTCVLCDWTNMDNAYVAYHINSRHHLTMLKFHKERIAKKKEKPVKNNIEKDRSKILDSATYFRKNNVELNFTEEKAVCSKCERNISFTFDAINKHIADHDNKEQKKEKPVKDNIEKDKSKILDSAIYFRKNNVELNFTEEKAVSNKCERNISFTIDAINKHIAYHDNNEQKSLVNNVLTCEEYKTDLNRSIILDSVEIYQNNCVEINFTSDTAFCNKCQKYISFDYEAIDKHIKEDQKNKQNSSIKNDDGTVNMNTPIKNKNVNKAKSSRNSPLRTHNQIQINAKQNVSKNRNENKIVSNVNAKDEENQTKIREDLLVKVSMQTFVTKLVGLEGLCEFDIIVNDKYYISLRSFTTISKIRSRMTCHCCSMEFNLNERYSHIKLERHLRAIEATRVITTLEPEFIREMRPHVYHCGYCNMSVSSYEDMLIHLSSAAHKECRTYSEWRLQCYFKDGARNKVFYCMDKSELMNRMEL